MSTVTGIVLLVTGEPDATPWTFSSTLREGSMPDVVISARPRSVKPVAGILTVELDPGYAVVGHGDETWEVTVPDTDIDLWDLIEPSVDVPPTTSADLITAAVANYIDNVVMTAEIDGGSATTSLTDYFIDGGGA